MRLEHSCAGCGGDLTRVGAPREPVYGLTVVVCPGCGVAVVRRGDARRRVPRGVSRVWAAWGRLGGSVLMLGLAAGLPVVCALIAAAGLREHELGLHEGLIGMVVRDEDVTARWREEFGPGSLVILGASAVGAGVYLGSALPHRSRGVVMGVWGAVFAAAGLAPALIVMMEYARGVLVGSAYTPPFVEVLRDGAGYAAVLLGALVMVPLGRPLGRGLRRSLDAFESRRFRRRRRRVVARRQRA